MEERSKISLLPFVSVIVLNHNGRKWLQECFSSLLKLDYPKDRLEIMMGDNASTDDSIAYTTANFPTVKIVKIIKNYGFCKSNNLCAQEANGEYLVFLNNDTFVTAGWLKALVLGLRSESNVLSCASKILIPYLENGRVINAAGGVISPAGCGFYDGCFELDSPKYGMGKNTGFGCGAGVLIEKKFFIETGGFDEYYFYSGEEMDLGYRVWTHGGKVRYVSEAVMFHYMGGTGFRGNGVTPITEFLIMRNGLYFILKNFEWYGVVQGLALFFMRTTAKVGYALIHFNVKILLSILKAHWVVLKDLQKILIQRKRQQITRKISDDVLRQNDILISWKEFFQRNFNLLRQIQRYQQGKVYDVRDKFEIKIDESGDWLFQPLQKIEG